MYLIAVARVLRDFGQRRVIGLFLKPKRGEGVLGVCGHLVKAALGRGGVLGVLGHLIRVAWSLLGRSFGVGHTCVTRSVAPPHPFQALG